MPASASIVIPTRDRASYLEVTLASIAEQARDRGAEILVVDDGGPSSTTRALVERHGARYEPHEAPRGLNVARNTGVERSAGALVAFLDDDVRAAPGWLDALLEGAASHPEADVLAGRIVASMEGPAPRSCGREAPPLTTLDLGRDDRPARFAWGANMAIRRDALERVGPFDPSLHDGGDEQEWQERLLAAARPESPRPIVYVAGATVEHRRVGSDAGLRALARTAYARGCAARRFDSRRGVAPRARRELSTLLGCLGHVLVRRCPAGLTMVAHSAGRLREARGEQPGPLPASASVDDFLSGESGTVGGVDRVRRRLVDHAVDAGELLSGRSSRLARAARSEPTRRRVLVLGAVRPEHAGRAAAIADELRRSRHAVELQTTAPEGAGKFECLNRLLAEHPAAGHDWLLVVDDDIELPAGFLDRFLFLCERYDLALAQPAHRLDSHAAWRVTRRQPRSAVRETRFVEIGPVTAFAQATFATLLPFPDLRMGWGLDLHWGALAHEHGWRCGIVDAVAIGHRIAPAADGYSREQAIAEARTFLAERAYVPARAAQETLARHPRW
ncbi:MAG TPA: glycosyltransferase family 2 protein [Solirubrobacteraceae bacterium]|jgi:GT2 family glycosyltransferase